jgi:hypothetical protein
MHIHLVLKATFDILILTLYTLNLIGRLVLAQILERGCFLLVLGPWCKCIEVGFEN